jgi:uncharacterized protein (DUF1501 family)
VPGFSLHAPEPPGLAAVTTGALANPGTAVRARARSVDRSVDILATAVAGDKTLGSGAVGVTGAASDPGAWLRKEQREQPSYNCVLHDSFKVTYVDP